MSLPEFGKLENRQLAKVVGLTPMPHEGGKMRGDKHIRGGRTGVRNALFMVSISAVRSNTKFSEFYRNLRDKSKSADVVFIAVAHKLLIILNSKMKAYSE